jgi:uncharacterized protein (TIGR00299 family) protein
MKTLYLECNMGAAGDMLMAALLELYPYPDQFLQTMNSLGIPGVNVKRCSVKKCGIMGTSILIEINGAEEENSIISQNDEDLHIFHAPSHHVHHHVHDDEHEYCSEGTSLNDREHKPLDNQNHSTMQKITELITGLSVSDSVKSNVLAVYELIASSEAQVHAISMDDIHFHEVGTLDAVVDIVGVCLLIELLGPEQIIVSPICVGNGHVKTSHGILPVPAPATAYMLRGIPMYSGNIHGELCTPTGAALIKHFADCFSYMPVMKVASIGYGMGKKDFEAVNCVRSYLGDCAEKNTPDEYAAELCCNLDDMTPEAIGYALQVLMENGALDAFVIPIQMKKNRPGQMLVCMCDHDRTSELAMLLLKHTTSTGVRQLSYKRYKLKSTITSQDTPYGEIRMKTSCGYGVVKIKPEYEDIVRCAKDHNVPFEAVSQAALLAKEKD